MRKKATLLILVCLVFSLGSISVFATAKQSPDAEINAECYRSASTKLTITNGKATVTATIIGMTGKTTKTSIHLYLQEYKNEKWVKVDDWSTSNNAVISTLTKIKSASKGHKYRTKAVCRAYIGSKSEKVTKYSSAVSY